MTRSPYRIARGALCAAVLLAAAGAQAQTQTGISAQQFTPMPGRATSYWTAAQADVMAGGGYEFGLLFDYANDPLVLYQNAERTAKLISDQLTLNVTAAVGIADRIELGLDLPVVLVQEGDADLLVPDVAGGTGIGDLRFVARGLLFGPDEGASGAAMALYVDAAFPTGGEEDFRSEGFRIEPGIAFDLVFGSRVRAGANLGYLIRPETDAGNLEVDDALTWAVASDIVVGEVGRFHIVPEINGQTVVANVDDRDSAESPIELLAGGKHFFDAGPFLEGGFGVGLRNGFGTPDFRTFLGLGWHNEPNGDPDGDGLIGADDNCPDRPEDVDGFEDGDGCPDPDNDFDGIADGDDACRDVAEDLDGYEDGDGCPDPDNDGDGIADRDDACPDEAEDFDGELDEDGCPDGDLDGDGIADQLDSCPNEPEDRDQWEDSDGCPDPDNDGDGILDGDDACPVEAEDMDGDRDEDGCPEGPRVTCDAIEIDEAVYFRSGRADIDQRSYPLLDTVAALINSAEHVTMIRVEGHTDNMGDDGFNLQLSRDRAAEVMAYLIDQGVDAGRLSSEGYGDAQPIADNDTEEGRAANRRVEFRIIEQNSNCP